MPRSIVWICALGLLAGGCGPKGAWVYYILEPGPNLTKADRDAISYLYLSATYSQRFDGKFVFPDGPPPLPITGANSFFDENGPLRLVISAHSDSRPEPIAVGIAELTVADWKVVAGEVDGYVHIVLDPLIP